MDGTSYGDIIRASCPGCGSRLFDVDKTIFDEDAFNHSNPDMYSNIRTALEMEKEKNRKR